MYSYLCQVTQLICRGAYTIQMLRLAISWLRASTCASLSFPGCLLPPPLPVRGSGMAGKLVAQVRAALLASDCGLSKQLCNLDYIDCPEK